MPTISNSQQYEKIADILGSANFDASEKWVLQWQTGSLGMFETAVAIVISHADPANLEILRGIYPMQVSGYERWALGVEPKIAPRLRAAGLEI